MKSGGLVHFKTALGSLEPTFALQDAGITHYCTVLALPNDSAHLVTCVGDSSDPTKVLVRLGEDAHTVAVNRAWQLAELK
jgi:hypothetical protein